MEIDLYARSCECMPDTESRIVVSLINVELHDVVTTIGADVILDEIGMDEAIAHFKLEINDA